MEILVSGRVSQFVLVLMFFGIVIFLTWLAKRGKTWTIRKIAGIEAIPEAIGRATEMGKPIYYVPGDNADLKSAEAPKTVAALAVLSYVARLCAKYKANLICVFGGGGGIGSEVYPLVEEIVQNAYLSEGVIEMFRRENIRYVPDRVAFSIMAMDMMYKEGIAAAIWLGSWGGTYIAPAGTAAQLGAIQIGGTPYEVHTCIMAVMFDYVVLGDELYAAAALVSGDPTQIATIAGQDFTKYIAIALIIVGSVLFSIGLPSVRLLLGF